jgi:hypothetical protein
VYQDVSHTWVGDEGGRERDALHLRQQPSGSGVRDLEEFSHLQAAEAMGVRGLAWNRLLAGSFKLASLARTKAALEKSSIARARSALCSSRDESARTTYACSPASCRPAWCSSRQASKRRRQASKYACKLLQQVQMTPVTRMR